MQVLGRERFIFVPLHAVGENVVRGLLASGAGQPLEDASPAP